MLKKEDLTTLKILKWLIDYHYQHNQTKYFFDKTLKQDLLIGELGYTDHTTINNWLTKIRYRYFDKNGEILIEKILTDGNELNDRYNQSIIKRNRMLKQWIRNTDTNLTDNQTDNLTIKVQSE